MIAAVVKIIDTDTKEVYTEETLYAHTVEKTFMGDMEDTTIDFTGGIEIENIKYKHVSSRGEGIDFKIFGGK